jgi:Asp/Glu/hydantoin racemase
MRILVVNPNTTAVMTEKIGRAASAVAAPGTEIVTVNPPDGPASIEGYYDAAFSVPGLLAEIAKGDATGVSAHIIACFDDTGLEAARSIALAPVIGIDEAAFHLASMLGHRFSVVTTLSRSIAAIENNLLKYGLASRCGKVRACELPVLSLDDPASNAAVQIGAEIALSNWRKRLARWVSRHQNASAAKILSWIFCVIWAALEHDPEMRAPIFQKSCSLNTIEWNPDWASLQFVIQKVARLPQFSSSRRRSARSNGPEGASPLSYAALVVCFKRTADWFHLLY